MQLFDKTLTRKFIWFQLLLTVLVAGAFFAFGYFEMNSLPIEYFLYVILGYVILSSFFYAWSCVWPLKKSMRQIRLLLTGRPYKKIYTDRIDEIGLLAYFFNEVTRNFEKVTSRLKEGDKMQTDLEIASGIQRDVLPEATPKIPGFDIVAKTRFADDLGGDCFGFLKNNDRNLIYIGDVTGHGLPAALVMMMVSTLLDTYAEMCDNALEVVIKTNHQLKPRIKATMFMTMLLLAWDAQNKKLTYVGAGHEYLFVFRRAMNKVEKIPAGGIALGMVPDNSALVKEVDLNLAVGDVILLFSDGITEARQPGGEMYGEDRLQKAFTEFAPQYSAEGILYHIAQDFAHFTNEHVQEDDMTMICMKYLGEGQASEGVENSSIEWKD